MIIKTGDIESLQPFLSRLHIPKSDSHKGQNGKVMVVGGSTLFHSAPIWACEIASHFADMVHFSSIHDNNEVMLSVKKKWRSGIVVSQGDMESYIREDDAVLLGTGMMRSPKPQGIQPYKTLEEALALKDEGLKTRYLTRFLLEAHTEKKWVIDAGALQMMDRDWLISLKMPALLTPHQREFNTLFGVDLLSFKPEEKAKLVKDTAAKYRCIILLKAGQYDIISDGSDSVMVAGGNAGLTKGGTGDVLAGLATALYAKQDGLSAGVLASFLIKQTAESLFEKKGFWFNTGDIVDSLPGVLRELANPFLG